MYPTAVSKKVQWSALGGLLAVLLLAPLQAHADDDHEDHGRYARQNEDGQGGGWQRREDDQPVWHPEREDEDQGENRPDWNGFFGLTVGPVYRPAPVYIPAAPAPAPAPSYWYYCGTAQAYYPYVHSCSVPWQVVPAR